MLMSNASEQRISWLSGLMVVFALSLAGAVLWVDVAQNQRLDERQKQRQKVLEQTAAALDEQTTRGALVGAAALMGLTEPALKAVVQGVQLPDAPVVLEPLAAARVRFGLGGAYVINANGIIVAHETVGPHSTGTDVGFRPYFQQAMQGRVNVYAAIGSQSHERGLYVAAPVYGGASAQAPVLGVVMFKMPFAPIDTLLARTGLPTLLLSPQGVVISATRPEWLYAVAPPLTQSRIDDITRLRQFGRHFDNGVASALPFSPVSPEVLIDGVQHAVQRHAVDWSDPGGPGRWSCWKMFRR